MAIIVKSRDEIAIMKEAGRIVSGVRDLLVDSLRPGMVELELDEIARREFKKAGVIPTFLDYHGYPATVCISINDEIVHGIPGKRKIQDGDIVSIDIGCTYEGFVADTAVSAGVGTLAPEAQRLIDVTREAVWRGIRASRAGSKTGDIGHAIQT
jgi:methionyl aminopeptidase